MQTRWAGVVVFVSFVGIAATPVQGPRLDSVMREKLTHSQKILEAVVTSNWAELDAETKKLEALTNDSRWAVLKAPEYGELTTSFRQALRRLRQAAAERDLDGTPAAYNAVTLRCVACHRYVARERIAVK
jgi:cytochrome c556